MRRLRVISIIIFIFALSIFGLYKFKMRDGVDSKGPEITMDSETISVSVNDDEKRILSGITAMDEKDGDVTDSLIVETYSNFVEKGRRNVTIAAFDKNNHVTKVSRELVYSDYHSPRFNLSAALRFPLNTEDIFKYISADDVLDGNLTSKIKVASGETVKSDMVGLYTLTFSVANSAGDVSELPVTVEIYDATKEHNTPTISLTNYIVYVNKSAEINPWSYVNGVSIGSYEYTKDENNVLVSKASNAKKISESDFVIDNQVDYNTAGVYEIVYSMTSENQYTGSVRLVVVVE